MKTNSVTNEYQVKHICFKNGPPLRLYPILDSTNLEAERYAKKKNKNDLEELNEGLVFVADEQTNGQGSFYKHWQSKKGGLYYSLLINCSKGDINASQKYARGVGNIARWVISKCSKKDVELELPNDLIIGYKKVGGILLKSMVVHGYPLFIVGIGININQASFDDEIKHSATSLRLVCKQPLEKSVYIKKLTEKLVYAFKNDSW